MKVEMGEYFGLVFADLLLREQGWVFNKDPLSITKYTFTRVIFLKIKRFDFGQ